MTRPTTGMLHSLVMDAARAKTPPDLRAVVGFEPYQGMERARGRLRRVQRPAQFPTN